jgi:6-phosphogluconolactonase
MPQSIFFIGSYTQRLSSEIIGLGEGIYTVQIDNNTGELQVLHAVKSINPSYLVTSHDNKFLYCSTEVSVHEKPKVKAYKIQNDFSLEFLNEQPVNGGFPCHIETLNNTVLIACYETGNVLQFPIDESGGLMPSINNQQHLGHSINKERQEGPHAHQVVVHPNKEDVYVCDLGIDTIKAYTFRGANFLANNDKDVLVTKGGGPRHLVFNKKGDLAYVMNELTGCVSVLKATNQIFKQVETYPSLPTAYTSLPSGSAIRLHPNETFLYAANRTLDAITIFKIQGDNLELIDYQFTNGNELREFNITPDGKWLIACHQNSHDTVVYQIKADGTLKETYRTKNIKTPVCVTFLN